MNLPKQIENITIPICGQKKNWRQDYNIGGNRGSSKKHSITQASYTEKTNCGT